MPYDTEIAPYCLQRLSDPALVAGIPAPPARRTAAWLYLLLLTGATMITRLIVVRRQPDLLAERAGYATAPNVEPGTARSHS